MAIPKDILAIERPKNTIVIRTNKTEPPRYAVRSRVGCIYDHGRRVPKNGPVIGHIDVEAKKFIPVCPGAKKSSDKNLEIKRLSRIENVDIKDWANIVLADRLFKPILEELKKFYEVHDAIQIYVISILRVCNKGVKDYELQEEYLTSYLSELYPNVSLSKNTVSIFLKNLGKAFSRIVLFMQNRVQHVNVDHHLLIDGTLKSNESRINSLSDYSRKALKKGTRDISVMYAFDLELKEPICSKCYPGNMLNPNLHFINPIKRDAKIIQELNLYEYDGALSNNDHILYRKSQDTKSKKWLYSFKDLSLSSAEEKDYIHRTTKNKNFSTEKYEKKKQEFGTIVLETDLDLSPEIAFSSYNSRWEIELVMRYYKHACEFVIFAYIQNDQSL